MLANTTLWIIFAGLINGTFIVPTRYVPEAFQKKLWLYHSLIGLAFLPWVFAFFLLPFDFWPHYETLSLDAILYIVGGGLIFGCGQLFFATAVAQLGFALSYAITLGIGVATGSLFVLFYQQTNFSSTDFLTILAVFLIILSLIIYYRSEKTETQKKEKKQSYFKGWLFAIFTGLAGGLQNITYFMTVFHTPHQFNENYSFWFWPPFLLCAALPMSIGFYYFSKKTETTNSLNDRPSLRKQIFLASLMGLFFSGALATYSYCVSHLSKDQQVIAWPLFLVLTILTTQVWGRLYGEGKNANLKSKIYQAVSVALLVSAVILLSATGR